MDACPECRAFLQPDWDRCKICGHVLGTPTTAEAEAAAGKRRRVKRSTPAPARRRSAPPARPGPPDACGCRRRAAGRPGAAPPLFADDVAPNQATPPRPGLTGGRTGWLVAGAVVVGGWRSAPGSCSGARRSPIPTPTGPRESPRKAPPTRPRSATGGPIPSVGSRSSSPRRRSSTRRVEQILVIGEMTMARGEVLSGGLTYTVAAGALPEGVADRDPDELLQRVVDRWVAAEAGTVAVVRADHRRRCTGRSCRHLRAWSATPTWW